MRVFLRGDSADHGRRKHVFSRSHVFNFRIAHVSLAKLGAKSASERKVRERLGEVFSGTNVSKDTINDYGFYI